MITLTLHDFSALTLFVVFVIFLVHLRKQCNLPPGPAGLPFIGSLHLLRKERLWDLYNRLYKTYGDIFSIRIGPQLCIVVNGYDTLREVFIKRGDNFSDRPDMYLFKDIFKRKGILSSSGDFWKQTRTFTTGKLRKFGSGKISLEEKIKNEVDIFLRVIENQHCRPFHLRDISKISVTNVICSIVLGKRYEHSDSSLRYLVKCITEMDELSVNAGIVSMFPVLKYLPGNFIQIAKFEKLASTIMDFLREQINKHKENMTEGQPKDFIDAFLQEKRSVLDGRTVFTDENLLFCVSDLFLAGTETTTACIDWAVLFLIHHPHVQHEMRTEIQNVVGQNRLPSVLDRQNMPYTEAVINEVLRCGNIVPLSMPHTTRVNTTLRGYTIPKGTCIIPNIGSFLCNSNVFKDPKTFNPGRFLGDSGNLCGHEKVATAFSIGRRVCIGESLARMELFLFLTSLVQRYRLLPECDNVLPSLERVDGATVAPKNFKIRALSVSQL